jgi:hypothetical protein
MTIWLKILSIFGDVYEFFKKHPKFFLGVVVAVFIMLFFKQCDDNRVLKNEIKQLNVELENENNRTLNNITALKDSVVKLNNSNTYMKGVIRVKEGESEILTDRLIASTKKIKELTKKLKDSEVTNVYITDISADISTNDVMTNINTEDSNTFSVGVKDSNSVFSISTQTWFRIVPNDNKLKLELLDRYGSGKSSLLDYKLNFSLTTAQIELPNGTTRILIRPTDIYGNEIPPSILSIPFADGVDYIDVKPQTITPPSDKKKKGLGIVIGPMGGLFYDNNTFVPALGIGVTVGYRIL